jgi:hypothetical protein
MHHLCHPAVQQEWTGIDGITDVSGIVGSDNNYKRTQYIQTYDNTLKKATFKRGNINFLLGDNYISCGDLFKSN